MAKFLTKTLIYDMVKIPNKSSSVNDEKVIIQSMGSGVKFLMLDVKKKQIH